jgi:hypothetical protein
MTTTKHKYLFGVFSVKKFSYMDMLICEYFIANTSVLYVLRNQFEGWFRLFGKGLKWKRLDNHPKTFSERNGYSKYFVINNWLIGYLA